MGILDDAVSAAKAKAEREKKAAQERVEREAAAAELVRELSAEHAKIAHEHQFKTVRVEESWHGEEAWLVKFYRDDWSHGEILIFPSGEWFWASARMAYSASTGRNYPSGTYTHGPSNTQSRVGLEPQWVEHSFRQAVERGIAGG